MVRWVAAANPAQPVGWPGSRSASPHRPEAPPCSHLFSDATPSGRPGTPRFTAAAPIGLGPPDLRPASTEADVVHPKAYRDGPDPLTRAPRADGGKWLPSPASQRVCGV